MVQDVKIERFRGFSQLEIQDCAQFNIILGENNSGKSSLLEALFLLSGPNNPSLNIIINGLRGFQMKDLNDAKVLFYKEDVSSPIFLSMQSMTGEVREMNIELLRQAEEVIDLDKLKDGSVTNQSDNDYGYQIKTLLKAKNKTQEIRTSLAFDPKTRKAKGKREKEYEESMSAGFVPSMSALPNEMKGFDIMVERKEKHILIDALRTLEPELVDIAKIQDRIWVDLGYDQMLPANVLGDGFRKVMSLITWIYSSKDGILLVDEIDNGMHFKSLETMWKALLKAATLYNVQLFASTHNIDSIRAYNKVLEEDDQSAYREKARIFALRKLPEHQFKAYKYLFEQFNYLINEEIELR